MAAQSMDRKPRDYSYALPKKMVLGALRSALSAKLAEQKLTVVDAWTLERTETKALLEVLNKLNHTKSALLVAHGENANLERASRNIEGVTLSARVVCSLTTCSSMTCCCSRRMP